MNIEFKEFKRWMSALLCCAMLFGMLPVNAFATENGAETGIVLEENVVEEPTESAPSDPVLPDISSDDGAVETVVEDPETQEPEAEEPAAEEPEAEEPVAEEPEAEEPVEEEPAVDEPVEEDPAVETPKVEEEPAVEQPAADESEDAVLSFEAEFSAPVVTADKPQMKYYNKKNYVAYDVAKSDSEGYNDTAAAYITEVTLGGIAVNQANSNYGSSNSWYVSESYGSSDADKKGNRVGQTLATYYGNLDTNDTNTNKTLVITPANGYYVTQVTVACCDGGKPYNCGTWSQGKEFTQTFNISTGGDLVMEMPSYAFAHGSSSSSESPRGEEQYFILIKVAPVPEPMFIAYDYGSIKDVLGVDFAKTPFADGDSWTVASKSNKYVSGGPKKGYENTRFKYAYDVKTDVSKWKHVRGQQDLE